MKENQVRQAQPDFKPVRIRKMITNYVLILYVAGDSLNSSNAIANAKKICEENLKDRYRIDIVDLYRQPQLAQDEQLFLLPTLVKRSPSPLRRIVGDLSDTNSVLTALDINQSPARE